MVYTALPVGTKRAAGLSVQRPDHLIQGCQAPPENLPPTVLVHLGLLHLDLVALIPEVCSCPVRRRLSAQCSWEGWMPIPGVSTWPHPPLEESKAPSRGEGDGNSSDSRGPLMISPGEMGTATSSTPLRD